MSDTRVGGQRWARGLLLALLTGTLLVGAAHTVASYVAWFRSPAAWPAVSAAGSDRPDAAARLLAGPAGRWLPGVLAATPGDANIDFITDGRLDDADWTAAYYLYPRRLRAASRADRGRPEEPRESAASGSDFALENGRLLAMPGGQPVTPAAANAPSPAFPPPGLTARGALAVLLTLCTALAWGSCALRLLGPPLPIGREGLTLRLGLALATGLGCLGAVGFIGALVGLAGSWALVGAVTLAGAAAAPSGWAWLRGAPAVRTRLPVHAPAVALSRVVTGVLVAWIALAVLLPTVRAVGEPMLHWDERFQWSYKARVLLEEGGIRGPTFQENDRLHLHRAYPLLVPALESHILRLAGGPSHERAVKAVFPFFFAGLLLVAHGAARARLAPTPALLVAAALASLPALHTATRIQGGPAHTGFADLPLALFLGSATALVTWRAPRGGRELDTRAMSRLFVTAALLAGFALLTKPEGLLAVAAVAAVAGGRSLTFVVSRRDRESLRGRARDALVPLAACLLVLASLAVPRLVLGLSVPSAGTVGYTGDEDYLARLNARHLSDGLRRNLAPAARAMTAAPFSVRWAGFGWVALAGLLVTPLARRRPHWLAVPFLLPLAGDLLAFTLTGSDIQWHLAVTLDRLWMHVLIPAFLIIAGQLERLDAGSAAAP